MSIDSVNNGTSLHSPLHSWESGFVAGAITMSVLIMGICRLWPSLLKTLTGQQPDNRPMNHHQHGGGGGIGGLPNFSLDSSVGTFFPSRISPSLRGQLRENQHQLIKSTQMISDLNSELLKQKSVISIYKNFVETAAQLNQNLKVGHLESRLKLEALYNELKALRNELKVAQKTDLQRIGKLKEAITKIEQQIKDIKGSLNYSPP